MTTVSTVRTEQQLRERVIGYTTPDGKHVSDAIGVGESARFFFDQAPENVTTPYCVARLINRQITMQGTRLRADLEIMVFDRPRSRQVAAEHLADWITQSLIGYRASSSGDFLMTNPPTNDSLPPVPSPGDSDLVQIRILAEVIAYPAFLGALAIPGH